MSSRRGVMATIAVAAVAVAALAAFLGAEIARMPDVVAVAPRADGAVRSLRPTLAFQTSDAGGLADLRVALDGRDVTRRARRDGDRLVVTAGHALAQGPHRVSVSFWSDNLFRSTVRRSWTFTVDTVRPDLAIREPAPGGAVNHHAVRFDGRSEPGALVRVAWSGGSTAAGVTADGTWSLLATLPEGRVATRIQSVDRAGNSTATVRSVRVDTVPPTLLLDPVGAPGGGPVSTDHPLLRGAVPSDDARTVTFRASVNGRLLASVSGAAASTRGTDPAAQRQAEARRPAAAGAPHAFALDVGQLAQGSNTVTVAARDAAGNVARRTVTVLVDSTEQFGAATLRPGARGQDVVALQERLRGLHLMRGAPTGVLDPTTRRALARYQAQHALPRDGILGPRTLRAMLGRIVVNLGQRKLRLIRDGRVVMTYPVAVGQPAYPTPTGHWRIVVMTKNPTWIPPNSPWAKGLGPIPPGPGNPLGTRWIGTSAPAVGIHGTYADYTVGTAASHGCLRMHIPDVERLYDQVAVGMPVDIRP